MPKRFSPRRARSPERPGLAPALERVGRRLVFIIMDKPYRLPLLGVAVFAAIMLGISLGNGAISAIDPIHFQGAAIHPRDRGAAVDPNAVQPVASPYAALYGWDEGRAARLEACQGCVVRPPVTTAAYVAPAPYFGSREELASAEARDLREIDAAYARREQRLETAREREAADRLERYMNYPVTEEPQAEPSAYPDKDEAGDARVQE